MASFTIISQKHFSMFTFFLFWVALKAQGRDTVDEVVFKVRAVGNMAAVTALFGWWMIVPRVHYPGMTVQADKGVSLSGGVGIMAALAFCIAYWCVLVFGFDDIHMAGRAGGSQC